MSAHFGFDFSGVRVHTDQRAAESARAVHAFAYTVGSDVAFAAGRYAPASVEGRRLLAHELAHVVQQARTPSPTSGQYALASSDLVVSDPSDEAEREAAAAASATGQLAAGHDWAGGHSLHAKLFRGAVLQRMKACPSTLATSEAVPAGWKPYYGSSSVFHCGYRGILEDRRPSRDDPQNECFYDDYGALVDENHRNAGCRGTPNQYDSEENPIKHALIDEGGIVRSGLGAFGASRIHDFKMLAKLPGCVNACRHAPTPLCLHQCAQTVMKD